MFIIDARIDEAEPVGGVGEAGSDQGVGPHLAESDQLLQLLGRQIQIGPPFFQRYAGPLALFMLFLAGIGPLIAWRKASSSFGRTR